MRGYVGRLYGLVFKPTSAEDIGHASPFYGSELSHLTVLSGSGVVSLDGIHRTQQQYMSAIVVAGKHASRSFMYLYLDGECFAAAAALSRAEQSDEEQASPLEPFWSEFGPT